MIIVTDYINLPFIDTGRPTYIYNLSSMVETIEPIRILPSAYTVNYSDEKSFDEILLNYVLSNQEVFYEFFSKLIIPIYAGCDVILIARRDLFSDSISEGVLKIVQQRYGYNNFAIINEPEDVDYIAKDNFFTIQGIYNIDQDKETYSTMYAFKNAKYIKEDGTLEAGADLEKFG